MSILTAASVIQVAPIALGAIVASVAFFRQRDPQRLYFVGILGGAAVGTILSASAIISVYVTGSFPSYVLKAGDIFLLISLLICLFFVRGFSQFPRLITLLAVVYFVLASAAITIGEYGVILSAYGPVLDRSHPGLLFGYSFLVVGLSVCSILFWRRGSALTGLMRGRMRLIGIAAGLAMLAIFFQSIAILATNWSPQIVLAGMLLGFAAGTAGYLGFIAPRWLRQRLMNSQQDRLDLSTRALISGVGLEELLQSLVKDAVELLGVNAGILGIWVQKKNEMVIEAVQGLQTIQKGTVILPDESLVVRRIVDNQPVVLTEVTDELIFSQNQFGEDTGSLVAVPIRMKDKLIGGLALFFDEGPFFSEEDALFLTLFANQAAIAIHNASLYLEAEKRASELAALNDLAGMISKSLDFHKILADGLQMAGSILRLDAGGVFLHHEKEGNLTLVADWNLPGALVEEVREITLQDSLAGRVALTGKPLMIDSVETEEGSRGIIIKYDFHSLAIAPLIVKSSTLGVLILIGKSSRVFSAGDHQLFAAIGSQISMAVENARLYQLTDQELQEKVSELTSHKAMLESTIQSITNGLAVYDTNNRLIYANGVLHRFFGQKDGSLIGLTAEEVKMRVGSSFADATATDQAFSKITSVSGGVGTDLLDLVVPIHLIIECTITPVISGNGRELGKVIVYRDVTQEKETQRIKDEFLAMISHELRTPLTAILGYTDVILRRIHGDLTPEQETFEISVKNNALRLLALINDLLDLSKIETGELPIFSQAIRLKPVVEKAMTRSNMLARAKKIAIEIDIPDDLPEIKADEDRLQQILENLLSNALKFTSSEGKVRVQARVRVNEPAGEVFLPAVLVSVADTGVGIPPGHIEKIWEAFHQAESSANRRFGGMGLGLSITKSLVELLGGRIWVESEGISGKGSIFYFTIPLAENKTIEKPELTFPNVGMPG